jgi:hypothetical protein
MSKHEVRPPGAPVPGFDVPRPEHQDRRRTGFIITALAAGWAALLWGTSLPLLAAIQVDCLGLGAIGTAIVAALWDRPHA